MKTQIAIAFALFLAGVLLGLTQLWFAVFPPDVFVKLAITIGALLAIVVVWAFLVREWRETSRLRNDKRLG